MKKLFNILIITIMMFSLVACSQDGSIIGKWHPNGEDESFYFEFKDKNELVIGMSGLTAEGTYTIEDNKITIKVSMLGQTILDEEGTYKINGDTLTITINDSPQKYTRIKE